MIQRLISVATFIALWAWITVAAAYETSTHWLLSIASYNASNLATANLQDQLGLQQVLAKKVFRATQASFDDVLLAVDPSCDPKALMVLPQLLSCGAMYEDIPGVRSFSHFFDPAHGGAELTVYSTRPGLFFGVNANLPSPDWALQDNNNDPTQLFSYRRARQYYFDALTRQGLESASGGRNAQWALLFQSLGQIIHHVQDMAQPQHTRNDPHADWLWRKLGNYDLGQLRHPSRFEKYSLSKGASKIKQALGQGITPVFPAYSQYFRVPRDFWTGFNLGMADYSNANFVSHGTNFVAAANGTALPNPRFPFPMPIVSPAKSIVAAFDPDPVPASIASLCQDVGIQNCEMTFYSNQWVDPLTGAPASNARASTESIFDEDMKNVSFTYDTDIGPVNTGRVYALNQLNFDAVYPFLIPRAVAYSAGLINYFFRGQMEIALPAEGIYSLVDHHAQRCKDTCGFNKVKLKLKNTTPNENMSSGTLLAVAKFHRNNCYRDDLSGDPAGPNFAGMACRSLEEEVVVSDPIALTQLLTLEERELTFAFPQAIPINATDLYLQVVFQGTLGAEVGAVAVVSKDIAEPNYFAMTNVTDMVYDFGDHTFHPFPHSGYAASDTAHGLSVAFGTSTSPVATLAQLAAPGHAQLAFLTDPGTQYMDIRYSGTNYVVSSPVQGNVSVSEFRSLPDSSLYGRTGNFALSRGVYRDIYVMHRLPADFTVYDCADEVELCAQTTMPPLTPATAVEWSIFF